MSVRLTDTQQKTLLDLARAQVELLIRSGERLRVAEGDPRLDDTLRAHGAAFVTLRKGGMLRGCIGSVLPHEPLFENVVHNAEQACRDPRFEGHRIQPDELRQIVIEISVLSRPAPVADPGEVQIGRDGVILTLGGHRGLFLPQVPVEQGWDRQKYLQQLGRKAGLGTEAYRDPHAVLETFTAQVFGETRP
jgi:AmmeMemoRadiSam system protein A